MPHSRKQNNVNLMLLYVVLFVVFIVCMELARCTVNLGMSALHPEILQLVMQ